MLLLNFDNKEGVLECLVLLGGGTYEGLKEQGSSTVVTAKPLVLWLYDLSNFCP